MAAKPDPYAGIEFDEINEATALEVDEIKCLKNCFDLFDSKKQDFLSADDLDEILRAMGFRPSKEELMDILAEIDEDGSGEIEFAEFCQLCAKFLVEDPDIETMKRELKDAFRIYDKNGEGFITMDTLRGLISELLAPLTDGAAHVVHPAVVVLGGVGGEPQQRRAPLRRGGEAEAGEHRPAAGLH